VSKIPLLASQASPSSGDSISFLLVVEAQNLKLWILTLTLACSSGWQHSGCSLAAWAASLRLSLCELTDSQSTPGTGHWHANQPCVYSTKNGTSNTCYVAQFVDVGLSWQTADEPESLSVLR
jgi:hypothetical protein